MRVAPPVVPAVKVTEALPCASVTAVVGAASAPVPLTMLNCSALPSSATPLLVSVAYTRVVAEPLAGRRTRSALVASARLVEVSSQTPAVPGAPEHTQLALVVLHCWPPQAVSSQSALPSQLLSTPSLQ